jgi:CheY-like chemotaxis protein
MPPTVLIVSDDTYSRLALLFHFADEGLNAFQAVDGAQARELLEGYPSVDAVFMDIDRPEQNESCCCASQWRGPPPLTIDLTTPETASILYGLRKRREPIGRSAS